MLEASADGGALKTERKGVSLYDVRVVGRAAHAGLEPERGVNATLELAHQALLVSALSDPARGTTVTPTAARAGHDDQHGAGGGLLRRRRAGAHGRRAGAGRRGDARAAARCCRARSSR